MISFEHGNLKLENVGKFYFLKNIAMTHNDLLELFQNIHNFHVVSARIGGLSHNRNVLEKDKKLYGKGVKDCLHEITVFANQNDIPVDELDVVNLQILWYDEVVE